MSHTDTVREFLSILNPQSEARPTILLGAGASFHSACLSRRRASNASRGVTTPSGSLDRRCRPNRSRHPNGWLGSRASLGSFVIPPGSARIFRSMDRTWAVTFFLEGGAMNFI